jgi:RND family efflux transporter MFP subunit
MTTSDVPSPRDEIAGEDPQPAAVWRWLGGTIRILLALAILAGSGALAHHWLTNRPTAQRRPPQEHATLVEVSPVRPAMEQVVVQARGTVMPAAQIELAARVGGQVVDISDQFVPGGRFKKDEQILQVERKDYELALRLHQGNLVTAQSAMKLEAGQRSVARREYELLGQDIHEADEELLLRQPQLAAREAAISIAEAALEKARLDLKRTSVMAPFNAVVQSRDVDLGSYIAPGTRLARLVGTDEYWVEVSVAVDELKWIGIPEVNDTPPSTVRIYHEAGWGSDVFRIGTVARLMTEIEPGGLMAKLLVTVQDPLLLDTEGDAHPMILGSRPVVEIDGKKMDGVVKVPRSALRDGSYVWLMNKEETLEIREVQEVWGDDAYVYLSGGLMSGDLLITSDLATPIPGMALRTPDKSPARLPEGASEGQGTPAEQPS